MVRTFSRYKSIAFTLAIATIVITAGCKKKGCTDPDGGNYDPKAKKEDGSCVYPAISFISNDSICEGTVDGRGSISKSISWISPVEQAAYKFNNYSKELPTNASSEREIRLIVQDANGNIVLDESIKGLTADEKQGLTAKGATGNWSITIELTDYAGLGYFSLKPNK